MVEYTPGPWVAKQSATDARQWSVGLMGKYHVHGCGDVNANGETPYMLMSGICSHKDAHLIAASPELLAQLEWAESVLKCFIEGSAQIESLRATIAKAKGNP